MARQKNDSFRDEMLTAFEKLSVIGEELLKPRSVTHDVVAEKKGETEPISYLHRFDFGDYFISLVYTPSRSFLTSAPSTLEARICLDKSQKLFFLSPYDVIPYINSADLICRYFPYIESPQRLASCYHDLAESLIPYLDDFARIAADREECDRSYQNLVEEMKRCFEQDITTPSGHGEDYDFSLLSMRFYHFIKWRSSFFSANEYNDFLTGNYSATAMLNHQKKLPDYIRHISLTAASFQPGQKVKPVRSRSASLPAMVSAQKDAHNFRVVLTAALFALPLMALLVAALYFSITAIISESALYYTAHGLQGYFRLVWLITFSACTLLPFLTRYVLRLFPKRYRAYKPYLEMTKNDPPHPFMKKMRLFLIVAVVLFTTLTACRGVIFQENRIIAQQFSPFTAIEYDYDSIDTVTAHHHPDGSVYYKINFKNGKTLDLSAEMRGKDSGKIRDTLSPLFEKYGITVTEDKKDTAKDTAKDTEQDSGNAAPENTEDKKEVTI